MVGLLLVHGMDKEVHKYMLICVCSELIYASVRSFLCCETSTKYIYWKNAIKELKCILEWLSICRHKIFSCENTGIIRSLNHVGAYILWAFNAQVIFWFSFFAITCC